MILILDDKHKHDLQFIKEQPIEGQYIVSQRPKIIQSSLNSWESLLNSWEEDQTASSIMAQPVSHFQSFSSQMFCRIIEGTCQANRGCRRRTQLVVLWGLSSHALWGRFHRHTDCFGIHKGIERADHRGGGTTLIFDRGIDEIINYTT